MKSAIISYLIEQIGHYLHGTTTTQWHTVLDLVKAAEDQLTAVNGATKMQWVKDQIHAIVASQGFKSAMQGLSDRAVNWLIETAVGYLAHL